MNRERALLAALVLLTVTVVAAPVVADVPDARLVISDVSVTPSEPDPGNTTTVEFTVENSAGSATGVNVERVALRERVDDDAVSLDDADPVHAEAEGVGALSIGDDVTLELSTAFEEAGVRDLEIVVETVDEDGNTTVVTRPVTVVVGGVDAAGITDDVQVDARLVHPSELDEDEQFDVDLGADGILGGDDDDDEELRTPLVRIEVTNFGTATARDVVVEPSVGNETLPRLAVADVAPGDSESVFFDAGNFDEPTTFDFEAGYTLGTERAHSETTLQYRPNRGDIVLTDIDMVIEDGVLTVTGNAANPGLSEVNGATIEVGGTDHVSPTYPARDYFLGTVPESEFARFDLTADVDHDNATTVPVTVTYLADGQPYERTVELEYDARAESDGDDGGSTTPLIVAGVVGSLAFVGLAAFGWRRYRGSH